MWVVVISAFILSVENLFAGSTIQGAFLGYLSVITASPLWHAVAVLKNKNQPSTAFLQTHRFFLATVFILAVMLLIYGYMVRSSASSALLYIFGIIGLPSGPELVRSIKQAGKRGHWYRQHLNGMIVSGIAAHTAFFAFGGRTLFSDFLSGQLMILPWVLPTVIGTIAITVLSRRHRLRTVKNSA